MIEYLSKKLDTMNVLEEKELLRETLENIFLPLYKETMNQYGTLEQRVKSELEFCPQNYTVYSTLLPKDKANGYVAWLNPVLETNSNSSFTPIENSILDTVFIEADWLVCKEMLDNGEIYKGILTVGNDTHTIEVQLKSSEIYKKKIAELYSHFINNGLPWASLNVSYFFKMFDIVVTNLDELDKNTLLDGTEYHWEISFGKYDAYIKKHLVPVWNITSFHAKSDDFPIPVVDKKSYEYTFNLEEFGVENGFLADYHSAPIAHARREENVYIVCISEKKDFSWRMFRFAKPVHMDTLSFPYPVLTNAQEDQFASRMISYYSSKVNTKAELVRIIHSFEIDKYIRFEDLKVLNNRSIKSECYEVNFFIEDEIRDKNSSKTLLLQFSKNSNKDIYLMRDIMSFIVSQIQLIYPEYNCAGALL